MSTIVTILCNLRAHLSVIRSLQEIEVGSRTEIEQRVMDKLSVRAASLLVALDSSMDDTLRIVEPIKDGPYVASEDEE